MTKRPHGRRITSAACALVLCFTASACTATEPSPPTLAMERALADVGASPLDGMSVYLTETINEAGVTYESMSFWDGHPRGHIRVWWQRLIGGERMEEFVGEFGTVKEVGNLHIITADNTEESGGASRLVRVYDDTRIVSVQAVKIEGVELDQLVELAEKLFSLLDE